MVKYEGEPAFIFKKYVKITGPEEPIEGKTGTVKCQNHINVREKATKESKLLGTAKNGETFKVLGKSGNWIKIDFNGQEGYVYKTYFKIS